MSEGRAEHRGGVRNGPPSARVRPRPECEQAALERQRERRRAPPREAELGHGGRRVVGHLK